MLFLFTSTSSAQEERTGNPVAELIVRCLLHCAPAWTLQGTESPALLVAQELQAVAADKAALQEAASAASAAHEAETSRLRAELAAQRVWPCSPHVT